MGVVFLTQIARERVTILEQRDTQALCANSKKFTLMTLNFTVELKRLPIVVVQKCSQGIMVGSPRMREHSRRNPLIFVDRDKLEMTP